LRPHESTTAPDRPRIDALLDEQSACWREGQPIRVEDLLARTPDLHDDPEGMLDLIVHELSLRARAGEFPPPEEYLGRFPWLADRLEVPLQIQGLFQRESSATLHSPPPSCDGRPTAPPGYEIEEEIGRGGMGVVYRARHVALNRRVALKLVLAGPHAGPDRLARIRVEAEAVARLQHPNVVQIFEVGQHDGCTFLALEFVEGNDLARAFAGTPQAPRRVAALVESLARAVHQVHRQGIVHRDLKPANILLAADGTPKIADFGLAKLLEGSTARTDSGAVLGTASYMAPEQASGRPGRVEPATDVYALDAVLYQGLTGRPPFQGETPLDTFQQVLTAEVIPPSRVLPKTPRDLETITLKCLEKDPARRYATAEALADDLRRFLGHRPIRARRAGRAERAGRWCRRNPVLAAALGLAATALVAVAGLSTGFALYQARAAERLRVEQEVAEGERSHAERLALNMALERGVTGQEADDPARRLIWLAQALSLARADDLPAQEAIRANLSAWAARTHPLQQIFTAGGPITAAVFRPDGRGLATASHDGRAQVWRVADGTPVGRPMLHAGPIRVVRFSPDGRRVLTASQDGTARLWNGEDGMPIGRPMAHRGPILDAAYSPDGRLVATASEDGTARLWSAEDGAPTGFILSFEKSVRLIAFSPDGRAVLTSDANDRPPRLWRVADGAPLAALRGHLSVLRSVGFSPDGRRVLTASNDTTARLSDAQDGTPIGRPMAHREEVRAVAFGPDGRTVVTASNDGTARLWDARDGTPVGEPMVHQGPVVAVAFSPDGRTVATAGYDNRARLWDAATGASTGVALLHQGPVNQVAFSPDGRSILTGSVDGTARLWQADPYRPSGWTIHHEDFVITVGFSPDGRTALTGSRDKTARLVRVADGTSIAVLHHEDYVHSGAFLDGGRTVMTASHDRTVRLWDAATGSARRRPIVDRTMMTAAVHPDGRTIVTGQYEGIARQWDVATGRPFGRPMNGHRGMIYVAIYSPDGRRVLTTSQDGTARLWAADDGAPASPPLTHHGMITAAAFSPDGRVALTGSHDHTARLWRSEDGAPIGRAMNHQEAVVEVAFSPDGRTIATAGFDNTARLWDADGAPRGIVLLHPGPVVALAFSLDGKTLLTGSYDGTARLWRVADGSPIGPPLAHRSPVATVAFDPEGRSILTGSHDGTARLWPAPTVLTGGIRRLALWVSVLTGLELTEDRNRVRALDSATWLDRRRQLDALGGPPS
jgi:WD40 repeat protein